MAGYDTVTKYLCEGNRSCLQEGSSLDSQTITQVDTRGATIISIDDEQEQISQDLQYFVDSNLEVPISPKRQFFVNPNYKMPKIFEHPIISQGYFPEKKQAKVKAQKAFAISDNIILVATLIATATFTAGFTVPGGFDGNEGSKQGMPILLKKAAFQAFVVSNALAFSCSSAALFGYIKLVINRFDADDIDEADMERINKRLALMHSLVSVAMLAMAISFITGIYVVLTPSLGLAISTCVTCIIIMVSSIMFASKVGGAIRGSVNFIEERFTW